MRRGEVDTEALARLLVKVFRSCGVDTCGLKILAGASPCDACPLADKLPHLPTPFMPLYMATRPESCRQAPALEALWQSCEAGLWSRQRPSAELVTLSLLPAAVTAATAAAAAAAAVATEPGGRSTGGRSTSWVRDDCAMDDEMLLGKLARLDWTRKADALLATGVSCPEIRSLIQDPRQVGLDGA